MGLLAENWVYIPAFVVVITVLVFVHEYGHYKIARFCGIKVDVFSIGFGKEIFGWYDKNGCRWRISAIPFGGYVKFFGDAGVASTADGSLKELTDEERNVSFHHKALWQRSAVVFAGPAANYIFAIVALTILFLTLGQAHTPPVATEVVSESAAEKAGILPGDRIIAIDGSEISSFEELRQKVIIGLDEPLHLDVDRGGANVKIDITPRIVEYKDSSGNIQKIGQLGIRSTKREFKDHNLGSAVVSAVGQTWFITTATLKGAWQMITGARDTTELSGPLGIIKMSGDAAKRGDDFTGNLLSLFNFMIFVSISLGLINLFPIPMLDGGHLLFYSFEAIRGRPLGEKAMEFGFRVGLTLVLMLMVFATWNDLNKPWVKDFFVGLFS